MGRKILLVTTDQQRFDTLACNGGALARTPVVDGLAAQGIRFERAHPQSVVCMPSRSTILTGQHPSTHGVWMNGVALPVAAPSVADELHRAGYRTALVGKAHFEPFLDPFLRFGENELSLTGTVPPGGLHRGFEHLETATHGAVGSTHYARWLAGQHPDAGRQGRERSVGLEAALVGIGADRPQERFTDARSLASQIGGQDAGGIVKRDLLYEGEQPALGEILGTVKQHVQGHVGNGSGPPAAGRGGLHRRLVSRASVGSAISRAGRDQLRLAPSGVHRCIRRPPG